MWNSIGMTVHYLRSLLFSFGPSGIFIEMVKAGGDVMLHVITDLINLIIKEEQIPDD